MILLTVSNFGLEERKLMLLRCFHSLKTIISEHLSKNKFILNVSSLIEGKLHLTSKISNVLEYSNKIKLFHK